MESYYIRLLWIYLIVIAWCYCLVLVCCCVVHGMVLSCCKQLKFIEKLLATPLVLANVLCVKVDVLPTVGDVHVLTVTDAVCKKAVKFEDCLVDSELTHVQRANLLVLLRSFSSVFSEVPGHTTMITHHIE